MFRLLNVGSMETLDDLIVIDETTVYRTKKCFTALNLDSSRVNDEARAILCTGRFSEGYLDNIPIPELTHDTIEEAVEYAIKTGGTNWLFLPVYSFEKEYVPSEP